MEDLTVDGTLPQREEKNLCERTCSDDHGAHDEDFKNEDTTTELGPEWIVLKDWRTSKFWRERDDICFDTSEVKIEEWSLDFWQRCLSYYGGAPGHIATPYSHRQAVEIAHELSAIIGAAPGGALQPLAFWICRAHAAGKTIRSLGFIAEELARRCDDGDDGWLYDLPYRQPDAEVARALKLANEAAPALERASIGISRRILFSTIEAEKLVSMIRQHGWDGVVNGINQVLRIGQKPPEGRIICGWSWFDDHIAAAKQEAAAPAGAHKSSGKKAPRAAGTA